MNRLVDKVAVVTGAANGIGKAIAGLFADDRSSVLVVDLEQEAGCATVMQIRSSGGCAEFCCTDVSSEANAARAVQLAVGKVLS